MGEYPLKSLTESVNGSVNGYRANLGNACCIRAVTVTEPYQRVTAPLTLDVDMLRKYSP